MAGGKRQKPEDHSKGILEFSLIWLTFLGAIYLWVPARAHTYVILAMTPIAIVALLICYPKTKKYFNHRVASGWIWGSFITIQVLCVTPACYCGFTASAATAEHGDQIPPVPQVAQNQDIKNPVKKVKIVRQPIVISTPPLVSQLTPTQVGSQPKSSESNIKTPDALLPQPVPTVQPVTSEQPFWSVLLEIPGSAQNQNATVFADGVEVGLKHLESGYLKVLVPRKEGKEDFRPTHFVVQIDSLPRKEFNETINENDRVFSPYE